METGKKIFSSYTFIVAFLISCIFIEMIFGKQFLNKFLWLILCGMLLTNYDTFSQKINKLEKKGR